MAAIWDYSMSSKAAPPPNACTTQYGGESCSRPGQNARMSLNSRRCAGASCPRLDYERSGRSLSFVKPDQYLCVALNALIEFFVSLGSLVDPDVVADNLAGLGPAVHD
jgi:hypothetical protein